MANRIITISEMSAFILKTTSDLSKKYGVRQDYLVMCSAGMFECPIDFSFVKNSDKRKGKK